MFTGARDVQAWAVQQGYHAFIVTANGDVTSGDVMLGTQRNKCQEESVHAL